MSDHPHEHEDLLAALLVGQRQPTEPEVSRTLRECAWCRAEWTRLQETATELERAGAERRAALSELARGAPAPGEERVLATLERLAREEPFARRPPRRALVWLAAAAVLVAGAWLARRFFARESEEHGPILLGDGPVHLVAPRGATDFGRFTWTYTGHGAPRFTLRIFELRNGERGALLIQHEHLEDTTWIPDGVELGKLSGAVEWEVEAFDEFRIPLGSDRADAWLSSR